jgi:hypothetical protein
VNVDIVKPFKNKGYSNKILIQCVAIYSFAPSFLVPQRGIILSEIVVWA